MAINYFVPEVWSASILVNLRNALVYGQPGVINKDYEGEIAESGDTVHITSFSDPSVRAYTKNTDISWDLLTDAERTLVVDQADYFAFTVDDVDKRQAQSGFVAKSSQGAAYNLAAEADTYVADLMIAATDGTSVDLGLVALSSAVDAYNKLLIPLRTKLTRNKVPEQGRWCVVSPEVYSYLLKDDRFIRNDAAATTEGLRNGHVGRAAGFDIIESNTVQEPTAGTYHVLAGNPIATTFAEQIASTEALRLQDQFGDGLRGLHLYGGKVVRPTALALASVTVA